MSKITHVDFQLARKFRTALSDAHALKQENVSFDVVRVYEEIYAKIKDSGLPLRNFSLDKVLGEVPESNQVVEVDFTPAPPEEELLGKYLDEVVELRDTDLSPDELEMRLLDLMTRAKRDGVNLNDLGRYFNG